jgi:outer membrane protein OmpA-like peptidoglycan-associated protein
MKNKWLLLLVVAGLLVVGLMPFSSYGKSSYFGVKNQAVGYPSEFDQTDKCINDAEQSPGARYCPDKIAQAKELAKQGVEAYWKCNTAGGLAMLAQACKLANEATRCGPAAAKAAPKEVIVLKGINFAFDSSALTPESKKVLDEDQRISRLMGEPNIRVEVAGHTDSVGSEAYNQKLSERRAQAVVDYLVSRGVDPKRLKAVGYGKDKPIASNATDAGRAENRRVELQIF